MCRHVKCRMLGIEGRFETIKGFKRIDLLNRKTGNIRVLSRVGHQHHDDRSSTSVATGDARRGSAGVASLLLHLETFWMLHPQTITCFRC